MLLHCKSIGGQLDDMPLQFCVEKPFANVNASNIYDATDAPHMPTTIVAAGTTVSSFQLSDVGW